MPENLRALRHKKRIVGEIRQITRAMKLVSAAKLKRALSARDRAMFYYSQVAEATALTMAHSSPGLRDPLIDGRSVERIGLIAVAGDKGLCGGFNASVIGRAIEFARQQDVPVDVLTVGGRAAEMARRAMLHVRREYPAMVDKLQGRDAVAMAAQTLAMYEAGDVDAVYVCYPRFVSRMVNEPTIERLLPVEPPKSEAATDDGLYLFEPEPDELLTRLLPMYVKAQVRQFMLEAAASEHSARLMAMSAATDSAEDILEELTRFINRARQAQITSDLLDVVGGADALGQ